MNFATPRQVAFIVRLLTEKNLAGTPYAGLFDAPKDLTVREASSMIDALMPLPRAGGAAGSARSTAPEGMHRIGDAIYKVQKAVHGSGRLYAKRLVRSGESWSFEFAPGMVQRLSESTRMTLTEAREWGALYGTCCACGRTLTDETSIANGIGPVCGSKF